VNTFNFDSTAFATYALHAAACASALVTFYNNDGAAGSNSPGGYMAGWVNRTGEIRCYNRADPKPRVPIISSITLPAPHSVANNVIPMDTALCLSYHAAPPVTRRRRGRIYFTGIQGEWVTTASTGQLVQFNLGALQPADRIKTNALALMGSNVGWGIWSSVNGTMAPIVGGYIDGEPDTQRRRGNPTPAKLAWGT
jgi:hypothetical protein